MSTKRKEVTKSLMMIREFILLIVKIRKVILLKKKKNIKKPKK